MLYPTVHLVRSNGFDARVLRELAEAVDEIEHQIAHQASA